MTEILNQSKATYQKAIETYNKQKGELEKISAIAEERIAALKRKIDWHRRRIERINGKISNLEYPYWTEYLIRPVMEELIRLTPEIDWEYDSKSKLYTMGLRCSVSIFGKNSDGKYIGVTFTHYKEDLYFDTGETKNSMPPGSIGELNGMNNVEAKLESMEQLISLIQKQQSETC